MTSDDRSPEGTPSAPDVECGHLVVAVSDDGRCALAMRQARSAGLATVQILVLRRDELPCVLVETDIAVSNPRWELRTSGLWVESVCETAGRHWSYGLEAFALAIESPEDLLGQAYGHRVPLGWELDFQAEPTGDGAPVQAGRLDGLVLTAPGSDGELAFHGPARRASWGLAVETEPAEGGGGRASWGRLDLSTLGAEALGLAAVDGPAIEVALPAGRQSSAAGVWWVGHDQRRMTSRWVTPF